MSATSTMIPAFLSNFVRKAVGLPTNAPGGAGCETACGTAISTPVATEVTSCCGTPAPSATERSAAARPAPDGAASFSIRPAMAADLRSVRELLEGAALPADDMASQFGAGYAVAVAADGMVVGAEGMETYGDEGGAAYGLLRSAVVAESWRGRGVGEALTRDRLAWARARGLREVYLLTTTAAAWFPKFGFEQVNRTDAPAALHASTEFASTCPSSATTMRLVLREPAAAPSPSCGVAGA